MTKRSYRYILILIVVTALVLTSAQVYFAVQNYEVNKQHLIQDVQQALNASIESYFADRAKSSIYILTQTDSDTLIGGRTAMGFTSRFDNIDSLFSDSLSTSGVTHIWSDTGDGSDTIRMDSLLKAASSNKIKRLRFNDDTTGSVRIKEFRNLTQKVMISISEELLNIGELYTKVEAELASQNLAIKFSLNQKVRGRKTSIGKMESDNYLSAEATSAYLGDSHSIGIDFENATLIILRNGVSELILSVLLVGLVIGTLIHLYQTINAQKQLAAIKDDLISNITHEFKTPIATIFSALEGVTSFNETNDPEKTKRYLALSNEQLRKLNDMVEKMLETATLGQGKLSLNREETEVASWTEQIVNRFRMVEHDKQITFETELQSQVAIIDRFHLENTVSNLIDNAIKYGGNQIIVRLKQDGEAFIWEVEDNGGNIPKAQRDKVFDKLYRIPSGNKHDVKGFGIGLYYARNIAELHDGELTLDGTTNQTLFKLKI